MAAGGGHEGAGHLLRRVDSDAVFGVRESLVADWLRQSDGSYLLQYDFVLNPTTKARR